MLNIGRLAPSGENYYLDAVASGVEDYYTGAGEAPGVWLTEAAAGLGLRGQVDADDLRAVLAGADPASGEPLGSGRGGRKVPGFDLTFRAPKSVSVLWGLGDDATAATVRAAHDAAVAAGLDYLATHAGFTRRGAGGSTAARIEGFVAAAFRHRSSRAGDPLLHTHVLVANLAKTADDGVWRTLDARRLYVHAKTAGYLYQAVLRDELTRRLGVAWQPVVNGCADLAGVPDTVLDAFSQRRAEILARMAERGESSAKAAQTATLATRRAKDYGVTPTALVDGWRDRAAALGFTPEHVAALVGREHGAGVDVDEVVADLAGPDGLTAHASTFTRRDVVQGWCARLPDGAPAGRIGRLADALLAPDQGVAVRLLNPNDRTPDKPADPVVAEVVDRLARRLSPAGAADLAGSATLARSVAALAAAAWTPEAIAARLLDRELVTADDPAAVLVWRAEQLAATHGAPVVDRLAGAGVIRRDDGRVVVGDPDEPRYSTPDLLALEQRLLDDALARQHAGVAVAAPGAVEAALAARPAMTGEQAAMVRALTRSGAGVQVVVGKAGAGKTYALDAARHAWQTCGIRLVGCALAARAAAQLADGAGIDSYTIDGLLADADRPGPGAGLAAGSVLVVDEAGMVGTRRLARLLDHAGAAGAKVVLVGDPHQLPEIDAGGVLRGLAARLPLIELVDNRRQANAWERDALDQLRTGSPAQALQAYDEHDRVVVGDTAEAVRERLVGDWWAATADHDQAGVMIAARTADVDDLNARARVRMAAAGRLTSPQLVTPDGTAFAAGDEVVCLRNDRRVGVINGSRGTVAAVHPDTGSLDVQLADGTTVGLPGGYLAAGHLAHGYALTAHKAQGLTTEQAWVLGSDASYREWGYVAMSRSRHDTRLYVVAGDDPEPDEAHTHSHQPPDGGPLDTLARSWTRSAAQHLAVDHGTPDDAEQPAGAMGSLAARTSDTPYARQVRWALEERDAAAGQLDAAHQRYTLAQQRLDEAPRGLGRARRDQRTKAHDAVVRAAGDVAAWQQRLRDLDERVAALRAAPPERSSDRPGAPAVDQAVAEHALRRAQAAEFAPPAYLDDLGPRPDDPAARMRWRAAVEAVEAYRAAHHVTDPDRALGERPADPAGRVAHQRAARAIQAARPARQAVDRDGNREVLEAELG